jgi:transcriptional regulator with XRE-family HTH domain
MCKSEKGGFANGKIIGSTDEAKAMANQECDAMLEYISNALRTVKIAQGQTPSEAGAMAGVTHQQFYKYTRGEDKISAARLGVYAKNSGVPIHAFYPEYLCEGIIFKEVNRMTIEHCKCFQEINDAEIKRLLHQLMCALAKRGLQLKPEFLKNECIK